MAPSEGLKLKNGVLVHLITQFQTFINYFNLQEAADLAIQPSRSQLCRMRTCRLLGLAYGTDGRTDAN